MRVAVLVGSYPEVSETFVLRHVVGLARSGHDVDVYAFHATGSRSAAPNGSAETNGRLKDVQLALPRGPTGSVAATLRTLGRALRSDPAHAARRLRALGRATGLPSPRVVSAAFRIGNPAGHDVIHCHFGPRGMDGAALRRAGVLTGSLIVSFHGWDVNVFGRGRRRDPYRRLFREDDAIFLANSDFLRERLIARGCPADRIVVQRPGVDTAFFSPAAAPTRPHPLRVLSVARLVEEKGIEHGIRAFARVANRARGDRYVIVGDGTQRAHLEGLTRDMGLGKAVRFVGWLEPQRVRDHYRDSDVFLFPSVIGRNGAEEGAGIALLEAQACGLPVLGTRIGGIPEMVAPELRPLLVAPAAVEPLASHLARFAGDPEERHRLGLAGRRFVCAHHDEQRLLRDLVALYERLATPAAGG